MTKSIGRRWKAYVVSVVLVGFAVPGWAQPAATRHSGTVTAVDRAAGTVTIEEIGPWRVEGGQTVVTPLTVEADGSTTWRRARRATGAGPSGWDGEFVEAPQGAWEVKPGDYVTVEVPREGKRRVAVRVTVAELDTR
jgi:hypothetical protein